MAKRIWTTWSDFVNYGDAVYAKWIRRANWRRFASALTEEPKEEWWKHIKDIAFDGAAEDFYKAASIYCDAPVCIAPMPQGFIGYGDGNHYW